MAKNGIYHQLIILSEKIGKLETLPRYVKSIDKRVSKIESALNESNIEIIKLKNSIDQISLSRLVYNFIKHVKFWQSANGNQKK